MTYRCQWAVVFRNGIPMQIKQQVKRGEEHDQQTSWASKEDRSAHTTTKTIDNPMTSSIANPTPTTMPIITILKYYPQFIIIIIESHSGSFFGTYVYVWVHHFERMRGFSSSVSNNCHNANGIEWEHEIIKCNKSEWKREWMGDWREWAFPSNNNYLFYCCVSILIACFSIKFSMFSGNPNKFLSGKINSKQCKRQWTTNIHGAMYCALCCTVLKKQNWFEYILFSAVSKKGENFHNRNSHNVS